MYGVCWIENNVGFVVGTLHARSVIWSGGFKGTLQKRLQFFIPRK
jgi:hypothetical protein